MLCWVFSTNGRAFQALHLESQILYSLVKSPTIPDLQDIPSTRARNDLGLRLLESLEDFQLTAAWDLDRAHVGVL